jgi:Pectate lyase superfamily protein
MPVTLVQQHNLNFFNVKDYGATGNGTTDDTTAIANAIIAANNAGGGTVFFPGGTYLSGAQTLQSKVHLRGAGIEASIIKLKNSANVDLFSASTGSINLGAAEATSSSGGIYNWSMQDMTLDGNKANQSSTSYPLRFYGYGYILQNIRVRSGKSGGILCDWNGAAGSPGQDSMEAQFTGVKIHDNGGVGLQFGGPHDSLITNCISYSNDSHNFHFAPNAIATQCTGMHSWGSKLTVNAVAILCEASEMIFDNCQAEGSDICQVVLLGSTITWGNGRIFAGDPGNVVGVQLGQNAGGTPYPGSINQSGGVTTAVVSSNNYIQSQFMDCWTGAINEVNTSANIYIGRVSQTSGTSIASNGGYLGSSSVAILMVTGLTPDGSPGKGGTFQIANTSSYNGFIAWDQTDNQLFSLNTTSSGAFSILNGKFFYGFSDSGSSQTFSFNASNGDVALAGQLAVGQSASAASIANNGTINTAHVGVARVTTSGNVTGVILQAGTVAGQLVTVVNESANTLTMATAATSHVADGTSDVIAATSARCFVWDSSTSRWYKNV